jgi:hypothetical protein
MWRLLLWRRAKGRRARGWATGLVVGLLSHPFAWFLTLACLDADGQLASPNGERVVAAFFGGLTYSTASLMLLGWLTVPVSLALGAVLGDVESDWPV